MRFSVKDALLMAAMAACLGSCVTTPTRQERPLPYPFDHCIVIKKSFDGGGPKYVRVHEGYEIGFCCSPCISVFESDPEIFMPQIREYYEDPAKRAAAMRQPPRKKYINHDD